MLNKIVEIITEPTRIYVGSTFKLKIKVLENIIKTVQGTKTITLENCVQNGLLELRIYGNNTVFDYLYPADDLFPSDTLYPYGDSRIVVTDKDNNSKTYELGIKEVLRQNGDVCDEYVFKNGQAQVIRRINKDGTIKEQETIENLGAFKIDLKKGTNTITIKNYSATIEAKFATQELEKLKGEQKKWLILKME